MTDTPATTATPKTATITMANMMTTTLASPEKSVLKRDDAAKRQNRSRPCGGGRKEIHRRRIEI